MGFGALWHKDVNNQSKNFYSALGKSLLSRYAIYLANLISLMMLARVFSPEIFGIVAAVAVISAFFQMMAEGGLAPAVINLPSLDAVDRNGIFCLMVLVGAVLAVCFIALSPVIGWFYGSKSIALIVPFLAVTVFFNACAIVPAAFLQRDQCFSSLALAGIVGEVVSTLIAICMTRFFAPVYALASKGAIGALCVFVVQIYESRNTHFGRPELGRRLSAIRVVSLSAVYQLGANFATYLSRNMDNVLVGKFLGASALGIYDKAYQLMRYPLLLLTFAMTPAIQPAVRKYASEPARVEEIHRDFTFKLSVAGAIASLAVTLLAKPIVLIILGGQWTGVVPLVRILAVGVPAQVVLSTNGSFFQALGRPDLMFSTGLRSAIVMIAAICVGVLSRNLVHLSWALVIAFNVNFAQTYYVMYAKVFRCGGRFFVSKMIPASLAVTAMALWH